MSQKKNLYRERVRRWIVARYLFGLSVILLLGVSLCFPTLRYTTSATGTAAKISAMTLISNAWDSVREALFGGTEQLSATLRFSSATLTVLIVSSVLFAVGVVATVWGAIGALRHLMGCKQGVNERAIWITLFPNRIALWLWRLPMLMLPAFPRVLVLLYATMLGNESVRLRAGMGDPLLLGIILLAIEGIWSAISAKRERAQRLNPFFTQKDEDEQEERETELSSDEDDFRKEREARALELRRILNRANGEPEQRKKDD